MKIRVTQERINNGLRGSCGQCPIALALDDATGQKWSVQWGCAVSGLRVVSLPLIARDFIYMFDKTGTGKPFEFEFPL